MDALTWILEHNEALSFALYFSLLGGLAVAERRWPRRQQNGDRKVRWSTNMLLTVMNIAIMSILPLSIVSAAYWAEAQDVGLLQHLSLPASLSAAVTLAVRALLSFATHYLMHAVPVLWRIHRVHHLDTELDVSTTVRFHPLEFLAQAVPALPVVVLVGLTPWVLVCYELLDLIVTMWSHSNVRLPAVIDRVVRCVFVTPDVHRVHHSSWHPETDSNFGAVFTFWDVVFGTFRTQTRAPHEAMELGLSEVRGPRAHRPFWLLVSPLQRSLNGRERPMSSGRKR